MDEATLKQHARAGDKDALWQLAVQADRELQAWTRQQPWYPAIKALYEEGITQPTAQQIQARTRQLQEAP